MTTTARVVQHLNTCDMRRATRSAAATELALSDATLGRWLADEGTGFKQLVRQERIRRIESIINGSATLCGKRLADACGYESINSFYRAFPSWFGKSFLDFRQTFMRTERGSQDFRFENLRHYMEVTRS